MGRRRFLIVLGFYIALTLAHPLGGIITHPVSPTLLSNIIQWIPVLAAMVVAPVAYGLFSRQLFPEQKWPGRALRLFAIVGLGALIRPYWGALVTDQDFTFDHEPEVELVVAGIEFVLASIGLLCSFALRRTFVA